MSVSISKQSVFLPNNFLFLSLCYPGKHPPHSSLLYSIAFSYIVLYNSLRSVFCLLLGNTYSIFLSCLTTSTVYILLFFTTSTMSSFHILQPPLCPLQPPLCPLSIFYNLHCVLFSLSYNLHYVLFSLSTTSARSSFPYLTTSILSAFPYPTIGMSTFRFFVNKHFVFLSLRNFFYFVSFSFLNSKKSKDSFIVY